VVARVRPQARDRRDRGERRSIGGDLVADEDVVFIACVLVDPQVQLTAAATHFDESLRLIDDEARDLVSRQLAALRDWASAVSSLRESIA
jgi:hypothetical protein